jgi:hypothetical protein
MEASSVTIQTEQGLRPRFALIDAASEYAACSRSALYEMALKTPKLFRKRGRRTVVDLSVLDQILDDLPVAALKAPPATDG